MPQKDRLLEEDLDLLLDFLEDPADEVVVDKVNFLFEDEAVLVGFVDLSFLNKPSALGSILLTLALSCLSLKELQPRNWSSVLPCKSRLLNFLKIIGPRVRD